MPRLADIISDSAAASLALARMAKQQSDAKVAAAGVPLHAEEAPQPSKTAASAKTLRFIATF